MSFFKSLLEIPQPEPIVKRSYRRELITEFTLPMTFSVMEGGFVGVIADKVYQVSPLVLAVITAAPMFSNLSSFLWARAIKGKSKVKSLVVIQVLILFFAAMVAFTPTTGNGLYVLVTCFIGVRILMTGQITARSIVWSLNYSRNVRGRITGRLIMINSLIVVFVAALGGLVMDANPEGFRWIYAIAVVIGSIGVVSFSQVVVLGEAEQLALELSEDAEADPTSMWKILSTDRQFARYQVFQFLAGTSNMMLEAPIIYLVSNQLGASYVVSIGIAVIVPFAVSMVSLPYWARYLDSHHVTLFRARQSVLWVISQLIMWVGAVYSALALLTLGRLILGIARGGGSLAWNLGHNDFASKKTLAAYMGAHVTLTGIRGAFAPFVGILLYLGWSDIPFLPDFAGVGAGVFLIAACLSSISWMGYVSMGRALRRNKE